ncbi:hypothetical protein Bca4012_064915 [Brassica carinata]
MNILGFRFAIMQGDGISLTSPVPDYQLRFRDGNGVGKFPKCFREGGDSNGFWGRRG